ncbi:MAG: type III secretion protein [Puniceicoccales bacterium]|jgi:methyl-accepting chemotaxis protein|nr:type III secretion protein [Puniceicoccales bacterium]
MKYILSDLMRVRELRKDRAERELIKAKEQVVEAKKVVEQRQKELEEYEKWVEDEIDRQYDAILKREVRKGAVDELSANIKIMRAKTADYVKRVEDAKEDVRKAEDLVKQKQDEVQRAYRNLEKLEAHKVDWIAEQRILEEFNSDKELEESVRIGGQKDPSEEPVEELVAF